MWFHLWAEEDFKTSRNCYWDFKRENLPPTSKRFEDSATNLELGCTSMQVRTIASETDDQIRL